MERWTREGASDVPERLLFAADEARLAVTAINDYMRSQLVVTDKGRSLEAFNALVRPEVFRVVVDDTIRTVREATALASKFEGNTSSPISLVPADIQYLGAALFHIGNVSVAMAHAATVHDIGFYGTAEKQRDVSTVIQTTQRAFSLFTQLQPIALSKQPAIVWPEWNRPEEHVAGLIAAEAQKALARRIGAQA